MMTDSALNTSSFGRDLSAEEIAGIGGGGIGDLSGTKILAAVQKGAQGANSSAGAVIGAVTGGLKEFFSELLS
jgi:hypothetical protein